MRPLYSPPAAPRSLSSAAYTDTLKAFALAREPIAYGLQTAPRLDYLPHERAEAPFYALLKALGLRPPGADAPTWPTPGGRVRMVSSLLYAELEEAVIQNSGMEPPAARRRVDAALSALYLAPFPAEVYNLLSCPYGRWTEAGWWMLCDWGADEHPEPGWHESLEILNGGRFAEDDDRCVNLREWQ